MRPLRYAVVCSGPLLPAWQVACLRHLVEETGVRPEVRVRSEGAPPDGGTLWSWYRRVVAPRRVGALRAASARGLLEEVPLYRGGDLPLDFVLALAPGPVPPEWVARARYGVWAFHFGDPERDPGPPPDFWAPYEGAAVTGAFLHRVVPGTPVGPILRAGWFPTEAVALDRALVASARWPARVCRDLARGEADYLHEGPQEEPADRSTAPSRAQTLGLLGRRGGAFLARRARALVTEERWHIGLIHQPLHTLLEAEATPPVTWLPPVSRNHYIADPFGIVEGGRLTVLCEVYDWRREIGEIAALTPERGGAWSMRTVLTAEHHLSYPFLLRHEGEIWMVPESAGAGEIALYRAIDFPDRWEKEAVLVPDFAGADATVFRHEGRWWMLATDGALEPVHELHAFHADDLRGPWTPHPDNPVKVDVRSSRGGGTPFVHRGRLYRPAQDGSVRYGGAVTINEIEALTPSTFRERPVRTLRPDPGNPLGLHTLSAAGDLTLVDGLGRAVVPARIGHELRAALHRRP